MSHELIGQKVEYSDKKRKKTIGQVVAVRRSPAVIYNTKTGEESPAIQFKIKPEDGSRAFWTASYRAKQGELEHL